MKTIMQMTAVSALLALGADAQAALTVSTGVANFSGSASVTATASSALSATATKNDAAIASVFLQQFDSALGVLTGASITLNSDRTQTISGTGNKNNGPARTANGSGSSTAALTAPGVAVAYSPAISISGSGCSLAGGPTGGIACSWGPTTSSVATPDAIETVNANNLNDYVGGGALGVALTLPTLSATSTLSTIMGQASQSKSTYTVSWSGALHVQYDYLLNALASFDGNSPVASLTLDFGTVAQNSIASLNFGLFNLANADRIGLDLDGFSVSGDSLAFSTDLTTFTNLAQGGSRSFTANLLTSTVGAFSAQYILNLSDADIGASSTWKNQTLTLNLVGNVAPVPVPDALWLFGSALVGMLSVGRRKAGI